MIFLGTAAHAVVFPRHESFFVGKSKLIEQIFAGEILEHPEMRGIFEFELAD